MVQIGDWVTICCVEDLWQIKTPADLVEAREALDDDDGPALQVWPTLGAALAELVDTIVQPSSMAKDRLGL